MSIASPLDIAAGPLIRAAMVTEAAAAPPRTADATGCQPLPAALLTERAAAAQPAVSKERAAAAQPVVSKERAAAAAASGVQRASGGFGGTASGVWLEYVDQINENNYRTKIRLLARSGSMLHNKFSDAFTRCVQDPCSQPPEPGWCLQNMVMYYYDPDRRSCSEFTYTGCGRNFNNFLTKHECYKICIQGRM
ncbi:hypothetical protein MRX96_015580 [Rhipicephalus microplus]